MSEIDSALSKSGAVTTNFSFTGGPNKDALLLIQLPIPPTSNHQYIPIRQGRSCRLVSSQKLNDYKKAMQAYKFTSPIFLQQSHQMKLWKEEGHIFEVRAIFFFHTKNIYTKRGDVKKMDVSNRLKALHDSLAELFDIDDSFFFRVAAEKVETHDHLTEMVCVEIFPITN